MSFPFPDEVAGHDKVRVHGGALKEQSRIRISCFGVVSESDHRLLFDFVSLVDSGRGDRRAIELLAKNESLVHFRFDLSVRGKVLSL